MNLYIMADSEGISGIYSREQVMGDRIPEGRALMTDDINVCAESKKYTSVIAMAVQTPLYMTRFPEMLIMS